MITLRTWDSRGKTSLDWLDSYHTFSFADYHDPKHMGFRAIRVINEDIIEPGKGFAAHSHKDMEIITYVLKGTLEHRDSMGNRFLIEHGHMQVMSAGTGITHSESNPSKDKPVHLMQIWILPETKGLFPSYDQKLFKESDISYGFLPAASGTPDTGFLKIHQDVTLYLGLIEEGKDLIFSPKKGRHAWVQLLRGGIVLNDQEMHAGDGAAVSQESRLVFTGRRRSEVLLFDLA